MQVGSLVECIQNLDTVGFHNEVAPIKGELYTVRSIIKGKDGTALHFEEITNAPRKYKDEFGEVRFDIKGFKEVQRPMKASALFKKILKTPNENRVRK